MRICDKIRRDVERRPMNIRFISLRITRYSDSQSIVTAYSRELGRVAFAVPAGAGRQAARARALTMPLGVVDCQTDVRPGRDILPLRQPVQALALASLRSDPVKQMMAMFIAEVLSLTLQTGEPDSLLFDFIVGSVKFLDSADAAQTANFHICFLYQLGCRLGIEPDVSTWREGTLLDMDEGRWREMAAYDRGGLDAVESRAAYAISRMTFENLHRFRFSRAERNRIVDGILDYLSVHYAPLGGLKTLGILRGLL